MQSASWTRLLPSDRCLYTLPIFRLPSMLIFLWSDSADARLKARMLNDTAGRVRFQNAGATIERMTLDVTHDKSRNR